MIEPFTYQARPIWVRFGHGTVEEVPAEMERLGARRALVLTTPGQMAAGERVGALLGSAPAGSFSEATMHTPVEVTERALGISANLAMFVTPATGTRLNSSNGSPINVARSTTLNWATHRLVRRSIGLHRARNWEPYQLESLGSLAWQPQLPGYAAVAAQPESQWSGRKVGTPSRRRAGYPWLDCSPS